MWIKKYYLSLIKSKNYPIDINFSWILSKLKNTYKMNKFSFKAKIYKKKHKNK